MLSKKYYEEFARILGKNKASENMVDNFSDYFKYDNPLFDASRFKEAVKEAKLKEVI